MSEKSRPTTTSNSSIAWLADAPLYIDSNQVAAFYDAVLQPESETATTEITVSNENAQKISGKAGVKGEIGISAFLKLLFPALDAKAEISVEGGVEASEENKNEQKITLHRITTPQRQLVQLSLYYFGNFPDRVKLVSFDELSNTEWREDVYISEVPRALVFVELPSLSEVHDSQKLGISVPETKIIPTAAEFETGEIVLIYNMLGSSENKPPKYPELKDVKDLADLLPKRREYWQWFDQNFSATQSMVAIEEACKGRGRIRWIDYRLPITTEGDTLHLHVVPSEKYDTGVFAYNFVKRGNKHGLRLVGTLKAEPDMNVLAVFER